MTAPLRSRYATALSQFIASTKSFEILTSTAPQHPPPQVLYVLDSSFNPPTVAHLHIASAPFVEKPSLIPARLLLLLATQNADKPSKPASFEDRLVMMERFAHDLQSHLMTNTPQGIDIAVTKKPYFVDKAVAIDASGAYPRHLPQTHLIGYDTLIRIFDPKYYPPDHTLKPLEPFLARNRLLVTVRPNDEWGGGEQQRAFLAGLLANGRLEKEGGEAEWVDRIHFVEGLRNRPVSSTRARAAACKNGGGRRDLEWLVPSGVREYLLEENPYAAAAGL